MKNKKMFIPAIILVVAILVISVYSVVSSIAKKPTITEGEFPFSITYELDGEKVTINDVYKVRYDGNAGYADTKTRTYVGEIGNMGEGNTVYTLKKNENGRIELCTNFYSDYMTLFCFYQDYLFVSARYSSAYKEAVAPSEIAVTTCLKAFVLISPMAKTPGRFVLVDSSATM